MRTVQQTDCAQPDDGNRISKADVGFANAVEGDKCWLEAKRVQRIDIAQVARYNHPTKAADLSQGSFRRVLMMLVSLTFRKLMISIADLPVRNFRAYLNDAADAAGADCGAAQVIASVRPFLRNEEAHLVIPYLTALAEAVHNR